MVTSCRVRRIGLQAVPCWMAVALAALPTTALLAQEAGESEALEEIIVTAQKREQNLQDVPAAVSALSGVELTDRNINGLLDMQRLVPSLNIHQRESSGAIAIRGIGFDALNPGAEGSVAVHSDGVFAGRPTSVLASFYDIERVEVARGPQGTLYGRNATAGALNVITRKPTDEFEGYVNVTAGNYNAVSAEGAVSGPLVNERLAARVAFRREVRDGYGTNRFNGADIDDLDALGARAHLSFTPTSSLSMLLTLDYFEQDDNAFAIHYGGPVAGTCSIRCGISQGGRVPADIRDVDQNSPTVNRRKYKTAALNAAWDISDAIKLTSISGYREGQSSWFGDLDATSAAISDIDRIEDTTQISQELQLAGDAGRLGWLFGAFYFQEDSSHTGEADFIRPPSPIGNFFTAGDIDTEAYAPFGELTYGITDRLNITAGARYSYERRIIRDEVLSVVNAPSGTRAAASSDFSSFTPKLGLDYHFDDQRMIYVSAQEGFKSGAFAVGALSPAFAPEEVTAYEAGLRARWFDRALTTNLTGFYYDYSDLHVGLVMGTILNIVNASDAEIKGVELEVAANLSDRLSIDLSGTWLDSEFGNYLLVDPARAALGPQQLEGRRLSQSPEWTGNLGVEYQLPVLRGDLTLRGEVFASSQVYFSVFNLETNKQPGYALGNVFATWRSGDRAWSATAFVRNVADRTVKAGSFVSTALVGGIADVTLEPPRVYGITLNRNF